MAEKKREGDLLPGGQETSFDVLLCSKLRANFRENFAKRFSEPPILPLGLSSAAVDKLAARGPSLEDCLFKLSRVTESLEHNSTCLQ